MTPPNRPYGRLPTIFPSAARGAAARLGALVLCLAAAPAFAGPGLAADSADQAPVASVTRSLTGDPLRVPDSRLMFASDVNRQIVAAPPAGEAPATPRPESRSQILLKGALALLGTPYRWGGTSPDAGFDCSGLVNYVFRTALGIELPRVSRDMARDGERIERAALTAGDLVFFSRRGKRIDHVGIYLGDGRFVHAPRTGKDVMVSELDTGYWSRRFMQARRIAALGS